MKDQPQQLNYSYEYRLNSGVLLLLNCPENIILTLDYFSFQIKSKFLGIKLIPYGTHYLTYSKHSNSKEYDKAYIKKSFFFNVTDKEKYIVKSFNSELNDFEDLDLESTNNFIIGINNLEFDSYLVNYPIESKELYNSWLSISSLISKDIISKFEPINHIFLSSAHENTIEKISNKPFFSDISYESNDKFLKLEEVDIKPRNKDFSKLLKQKFIKDNFRDKTEYLNHLLSRKFNNSISDYIAEIQLSFIVFQIGEILEGYEQFILLLSLFFDSYSYSKNKDNYKEVNLFIESIYDILSNCDKEFFNEESNKLLLQKIEYYIEDIYCFYSDLINIEENKNLNSIINNESEDNNSKLKIYKKVLKRIKYFVDFMGEYFGIIIKSEDEKIVQYYLARKIQNKGEKSINAMEVDNIENYDNSEFNDKNNRQLSDAEKLKKYLFEQGIDDEDMPTIVEL